MSTKSSTPSFSSKGGLLALLIQRYMGGLEKSDLDGRGGGGGSVDLYVYARVYTRISYVPELPYAAATTNSVGFWSVQCSKFLLYGSTRNSQVGKLAALLLL